MSHNLLWVLILTKSNTESTYNLGVQGPQDGGFSSHPSAGVSVADSKGLAWDDFIRKTTKHRENNL